MNMDSGRKVAPGVKWTGPLDRTSVIGSTQVQEPSALRRNACIKSNMVPRMQTKTPPKRGRGLSATVEGIRR